MKLTKLSFFINLTIVLFAGLLPLTIFAGGEVDPGAEKSSNPATAIEVDSATTVTIWGKPAAKNRLLARFTSANAALEATKGNLKGVLSGMGTEVAKALPSVPELTVLNVTLDSSQEGGETALLQKIKELEDSGLFDYVEPDWILSAQQLPTDSAFATGDLWGLRNTGQNGGIAGIDVSAVGAWTTTTGSADVVVAVIDSGVRYTHQDLLGNMWTNPAEIPGNGIDDDNNGYVDDVYGINAITGSGDPLDDRGHGTHVAGTIAATANDTGRHVGLAYGSKIMALKFLGADGTGFTSDAVECVQYAIDQGARIMNNSWGGGGYSQALYDAINTANSLDILFLAAAGNNGLNSDIFTYYPQGYDLQNIISVAAIDRTGELAWFSNFGATTVDIAAPGVSILSCVSDSDSSYAYYDGTSMATPHAAGAAALLASVYPSASVSELKQRLLSGGEFLSSMGGITLTSNMLNAAGSLDMANDGNLEIFVSLDGNLLEGEAVPVHITVTDLDPVTNATAFANFDGNSSFMLYDDGAPPDQAAGDGIYSGLLTVPSGTPTTTLNLSAFAPGKNFFSNSFLFEVLSPPPNNAFANRIVLEQLTTSTTGNNIHATSEAGEPRNPSVAGGKSVWWEWTAPWDGTYQIDTFGSTYDTTLALYTGSDLASLELVASNDDSSSLQSAVSVTATAGTVYQIQVDGYGGSEGDIVLNYSAPGPISASPLEFNIAASESDGFTTSVTLRNAGSSSLSYTFSSDQAWLTSPDPSGALAPGSEVSLQLDFGPLPAFTDYLYATISLALDDPVLPLIEIPVTIVEQSLVVSIPDPNLLAAIEAALNKAPGEPITSTDMASLASLSASRRSIIDLTGLEHATRLQSLDLIDNDIVDISALSGLTNLTALNLEYNTVSDLSPLSGLTNLEFLALQANNFADLSSLSGLTSLVELMLDYNFVSDLSPLSGLTSLRYLSVRENAVSDISPLSNLTNLVHLHFGSNQVTDLTPLQGLGGLEQLYAYDNAISDMSPLGNLSNLYVLSLFQNQISVLPSLPSFTQLVYLWLYDNQISDVSPLGSLTSLQYLDLHGNAIASAAGLETLTSLKELDLSVNQLTDISALASLGPTAAPDLRLLWLHDNQLSTIAPLFGLTQLRNVALPAVGFYSPDPWNAPGLRLENNFLNVSEGTFTRTIIDTLDAIDGLDVLFNPQNFPDISVDPASLTLGSVPGASFTSTLSVTNDGAADLTYSTASDQTWLTVEPASGTLAPGQTAALDLFFGPLPEFSNTLNAIITLASNDPDSPTVDIPVTIAYAPPITFPDGNLRLAIEQELELPAGSPITSSEMQQLIYLNASVDSITDITGLEYAVNLEFLYLGDNEISDLAPLASLTQLRRLQIDGNTFSDLSPLSGLVNLEWLDLDGNQLSDIAALATLTQLTWLDLSSNQISDLTPLAALTSLESLNAAYNQISDLSPLASLTHLSALYLRSNQISDLSPISPLNALRILGLNDNQISNLAPLASLATLRDLDLDRNQISDLAPLASLTNLVYLNLHSNQISDLAPLASLTNLVYLYLQHNQISDLTPLASLASLHRLFLYHNQISELTPLASLSSLQYLDLDHNGITSTAGLGTLTSLRELDLSFNELTDISALAGLGPAAAPDLRLIWLNDNFLEDISALSGLTQLRNVSFPPVAYYSPSPWNAPGLRLDNNLLDVTDGSADRAIIDPLNAIDGLEVTYVPQRESEIGVYPGYVDLGATPGDAVTYDLVIDNAGSAALTYSISSDQPWLTVDPASGSVPVGAHLLVTLSAEVPLSLVGTLSATLAIASNDPVNPSLEVPVQIVNGPAIVNIADPALRVSVENSLGKAPGELIYATDMESLTSLDFNNDSTRFLNGLEYAVNLEELYIEFTRVRDITPVAPLTNLSWLDLSDNLITDVSPLSSLTGVTTLFLDDNAINDLSPLAGLVNVERLDLDGNQFSDISALSNLTALTWIDLSSNQVADLSPLSSLASLSYLNLGSNQLSDISQLASLTNLSALVLYGNPIADLSPLGSLGNLISLNLSDTQISDLSPLASLTTLSDLYLWSNQVSDLTPLASLTNLVWLDLGRNPVTDLAPLASLTNLTWLGIYELQVDDITQTLSQIGSLTSLTGLDLGRNGIRDLSPLAPLTNLEQIYMASNQISDLSPLAQLTRLRWLYLGENRIRDVTPLGSLTDLNSLYLDFNYIHDVSPLASLTNLGWLDIDYNLLDINPGSGDRAILDAIAVYSGVDYTPQRDLMRTIADWAAEFGIPEGERNDEDTHGPLQVPNLLAYGMGLNPFTLTPDHMPASELSGSFPAVNTTGLVESNAGTNTFAFYYFRDVTATGVTLSVLTSEGLDSWNATKPVAETILWDDGQGHHYVEALFETTSDKLFFQLEVLRY